MIIGNLTHHPRSITITGNTRHPPKFREENKLFSTIDIKSAFRQIELEDDSKDIRDYRCKRMPFGLSNSPLTYMRLINILLHGLMGNTTSVFLDDISIVSQTAAEHLGKLELVFSRLSSAGLKVKLEKSNFLQEKIVFLRHQIDKHGLRTVQSKVEAVRN